jgi:hypothetical protein
VHCVYFIAIKDGPVKIGATANLNSRFYQLSSAVPYQLEFLGAVSCADKRATFAEEERLHRLLKKHRLRGEWFKREPVLRLFKTVSIDITTFKIQPHIKTRHSVGGDEELTRRFEIRCSKQELELWKKTAHEMGITVALLIRDSANASVEDSDVSRSAK